LHGLLTALPCSLLSGAERDSCNRVSGLIETRSHLIGKKRFPNGPFATGCPDNTWLRRSRTGRKTRKSADGVPAYCAVGGERSTLPWLDDCLGESLSLLRYAPRKASKTAWSGERSWPPVIALPLACEALSCAVLSGSQCPADAPFAWPSPPGRSGDTVRPRRPSLRAG